MNNWREFTDKFRDHSYYSLYRFLIKNNPKNILEIGVDLGAPFYYWREFFPESKIWGIDNRTLEECAKYKNCEYLPIPENNVYINSDIKNVDFNTLPDFDVILDDTSHWKEEQVWALNSLYPKLTANGIYIIEDISSLENARYIIDNFTGSKDNLMLIDRTFVKGRIDDIVIVYYNEKHEL